MICESDSGGKQSFDINNVLNAGWVSGASVVFGYFETIETKIKGGDGDASLYSDLLQQVSRLGHIHVPNPGMNPARIPEWLAFAEQFQMPVDSQSDTEGILNFLQYVQTIRDLVEAKSKG
jgi:hypothetical protein